MRKFIKIVVIFTTSCLALGVLLSIALRVIFPPAKLRELVLEQIRIKLQREAQLGNADIGLTGLSLDRIRLSEVPAFSVGTFLAVDHLKIRWSLLPLLSRQVVIQDITLEKPQINLIRMQDGVTYNVSDLAGATTTSGKTPVHHEKTSSAKAEHPRTAEAAAKTEWSWMVEQIHLSHGTINFDDRSPAHQTSALSDIDLLIRDFDPTHIQGHLTIAQLQNPVYQARDFSTEWALHGIDPTLGHLNGWMKLKQGPGNVQNLTSLTNSSKSAKLALMPLVLLQNVDKLGFVKLGLPDFSHFPITNITGDYVFTNGTMKIQTFDIASPELSINALGTIELVSGRLAVNVNMHAPKKSLLGETDLKLSISGTLSDPKTNLDDLKKKAFKATVNQLMKNPDVNKAIDNTLKQLFH